MTQQTEILDQIAPASKDVGEGSPRVQLPGDRADNLVAPQGGGGSCACGAAPDSGGNCGVPRSFVYAIGRVEARFPNLSAEKEFAQATGRTETAGKTDQQSFHAVLSKREHRYLLRQLCWVLTVQGLETYLLVPRDPAAIDLLVEAIRPAPTPSDIDVVIGVRGPIAPPTMCNGLMIPIVAFDQIYSFDREALIKAIPKPEKTSAAQFAPAAEELFGRIMQLTDNAGTTDDHRALNYLAMRYPAIYARAAEKFATRFLAIGRRGAPLAAERHTQHCRCDLRLHKSQYGFYGKILRASRR